MTGEGMKNACLSGRDVLWSTSEDPFAECELIGELEEFSEGLRFTPRDGLSLTAAQLREVADILNRANKGVRA
ncbi:MULTISPECIES: hypothetical protein [unclassified Luteococcus]|uniref:hypothetical protein n=1 Tax=unclassified Luteococcus TaxID=2639923 RepID=UPI00313CCF40